MMMVSSVWVGECIDSVSLSRNKLFSIFGILNKWVEEAEYVVVYDLSGVCRNLLIVFKVSWVWFGSIVNSLGRYTCASWCKLCIENIRLGLKFVGVFSCRCWMNDAIVVSVVILIIYII